MTIATDATKIEGPKCSCGKAALEHSSAEHLRRHHYDYFHKTSIPECPVCAFTMMSIPEQEAFRRENQDSQS